MILALIKDKKMVSSSKVGSSSAKAKASSSKAKASKPADDSDSDIELIESKPSSTSTSRPKATTNDSSTSDIEVVHPALGWVYVGSHNFTPSAWGTLSGSGFNPTLNVRPLSSPLPFLFFTQALKQTRDRLRTTS